VIIGLDWASDRWHARTDSGDAPSVHLPTSRKADKERWGSPDVRREELAYRWRLNLVEACMVEGDAMQVMVFCEAPLALRNPATNILMGLMAGALWEVGHSLGVQWVWVPQSTWKKEIVGNGNAKKLAIMAHVAEHLGLVTEDDNVADARCILEYGLRALSDEWPDVRV
jgi:uncharacterized membrane protein